MSALLLLIFAVVIKGDEMNLFGKTGPIFEAVSLGVDNNNHNAIKIILRNGNVIVYDERFYSGRTKSPWSFHVQSEVKTTREQGEVIHHKIDRYFFCQENTICKQIVRIQCNSKVNCYEGKLFFVAQFRRMHVFYSREPDATADEYRREIVARRRDLLDSAVSKDEVASGLIRDSVYSSLRFQAGMMPNSRINSYNIKAGLKKKPKPPGPLFPVSIACTFFFFC